MTRTDHLTLVERLVMEGFARGDDSVVDDLVTPCFLEHQFGLEGSGPQAIAGLKQAIRDVKRMIPDITYTIDDHVDAGDTLWVRMTSRGTHSARTMGQEPTGRPLSIQVIDVCRFEGDRIAERWGVPDRFALLVQTGALP